MSINNDMGTGIEFLSHGKLFKLHKIYMWPVAFYFPIKKTKNVLKPLSISICKTFFQNINMANL